MSLQCETWIRNVMQFMVSHWTEMNMKRGNIKMDGPLLSSYELIGDGLMLQLAKQELGSKIHEYNIGSRKMQRCGLCVSGQTVNQLKKRLLAGASVSRNVVISIGYNDMLQETKIGSFRIRLYKVIKLCLSKGARNIVLLTIPPIPNIVGRKGYKILYKAYDDAITSSYFGKKVKILDICPVFLANIDEVEMDLFEKFDGGATIDLIHWNARGLRTVADYLREYLPPALE